LITSSATQLFTTSTLIVNDGSTFASFYTGTSVVPITTTVPTSTGSPSLNGGKGKSGSSGLSSSQKKTIIGVVVGIGGAILVGGLAVVAYRIWGRKKHAEDEDDLYDPNDNSLNKEKTSNVSGQSPFKSTLDQYHTPGPVNTASNF